MNPRDPFSDLPFAELTIEGLPLISELEFPEFVKGGTVNTEPICGMLPGTVRIGKIAQNPDGTLTVPFEYRPEGWKDEQETIKS